jgi:hypothetical protein
LPFFDGDDLHSDGAIRNLFAPQLRPKDRP